MLVLGSYEIESELDKCSIRVKLKKKEIEKKVANSFKHSAIDC